VTFLFDNNVSRALAQALRILGKSVNHIADIQELGHGADDRAILEYAGPRSEFVVTRDFAQRKVPQFKADVIQLKAGVFMLYTGSARQLRAWEIAKMVVRAWDNMELFARTNSVPFVVLIRQNGTVVTYH